MPTRPATTRAIPRAARCVTALTVLSLLAPAAGALAPQPPGADGPQFAAPAWAAPAPADIFTRQRSALLHDAKRFAPAFRAPSATTCARPMRTHEEAGTQAHTAPGELRKVCTTSAPIARCETVMS